MLNLQQKRKNALDKISEMFVNCKLRSFWVTFLIYKKLYHFFLFLSNRFGPQGRWTALDIYLYASRLGIHILLLNILMYFLSGICRVTFLNGREYVGFSGAEQ